MLARLIGFPGIRSLHRFEPVHKSIDAAAEVGYVHN